LSPIAIGIHGGCGTLDAALLSASEWAETREHVANALRAGCAELAAGDLELEAVV
jgi:beta-aspartyl-peptidase (threonine type)